MGRMGESIAVLDGFELSSISVSPDDADGRIGQVRAGVPGMDFAGYATSVSPDDEDGRIGQVRAGAVGMDFASYDTSPNDADGRIGQTRAFPNQYAPSPQAGVLVKRNMIQASNGANYAGGSSWYPGAPTMPAQVGLADGYGKDGLGDGYGRAGLGDGYGRAGLGGGCAGCGSADADLSSAFDAYDNVTKRRNVIDPSAGANYGGGSSFSPGMPLVTSTIGLADMEPGMDPGLDADLVNYMNATNPALPNVSYRKNVIDPSDGMYSGGSSFAPGMPLLVSSAGLAELSLVDRLDGANSFPQLAADARALFDKLAGRNVLLGLRAKMKMARVGRTKADVAAMARQFAIARRIRRAVSQSRTLVTQAALNQIAMSVASAVARSPVKRVA